MLALRTLSIFPGVCVTGKESQRVTGSFCFFGGFISTGGYLLQVSYDFQHALESIVEKGAWSMYSQYTRNANLMVILWKDPLSANSSWAFQWIRTCKGRGVGGTRLRGRCRIVRLLKSGWWRGCSCDEACKSLVLTKSLLSASSFFWQVSWKAFIHKKVAEILAIIP